MEIPKDLKPLYDLAKEADQGEWCPSWTYSAIRHVVRNCDIECGEHPDNSCPSFGRYDGTFIAAANASRVIQLIERIASLEAALREKKLVKCAKCSTQIPTSEVIRCVDCKQPLCEKHIFTHFDVESKRVREQLKDRTAERDHLDRRNTSLEQELAQARADIECLTFERDESRAASQQTLKQWYEALAERDSLRSQLESLSLVMQELRDYYCNNECERLPDHDGPCVRARDLLAARAKQETKP